MRNWFKRKAAAVRRKVAMAINPGQILGTIPLSRFTDFDSYLDAGTSKMWATFTSCKKIADVMDDTPHKLIKKDGDGDPVEVRGISQLLASPNPYETLGEMRWKWVFHIILTGNAYWYKAEANMMNERPQFLYALNPKHVQIVIDPQKGLIGYIYNVAGRTITFDVGEIVHWRRPHANKDFYGIGDIEAAENLYNEYLNRDQINQHFWKNGARPSGIMIGSQVEMSETEFEKLKERHEKQYHGPDKTGKTMWLTSGDGQWTYQQLSYSAEEMQALESQKWNIENIFTMHGVPLSVAGLRDTANYAIARIDDLRFRKYTIKPLLKLFAETFNSDIVNGFDPSVKLVHDLQGLVDLNQVAEDLTPLFDRGAINLNELREAAGYNRIDDPTFNQHFVNAGLVPLDLAGIADMGKTNEAAKDIVRRFLTTKVGSREE